MEENEYKKEKIVELDPFITFHFFSFEHRFLISSSTGTKPLVWLMIQTEPWIIHSATVPQHESTIERAKTLVLQRPLECSVLRVFA